MVTVRSAGAPPTVIVDGMRGLGDNVYQRAFVRTLSAKASAYIATPWPELYDDLPVRFVHAATSLRTQARNLERQPAGRWSPRPPRARLLTIRYGSRDLRQGSIVGAMERCFGVRPAAWDLPTFPRMTRQKPIAVVRPVTARAEWLNTARAPRPEYVFDCAADLFRDYHVVSVADVAPGVEWFVGEPPPAHERFHAGELDVRALLGLIQSAAVVVGGVGWIVPACIAARVPLFCILGGHGGHNAPAKITDSRMGLDHVRFAVPDAFCECEGMRHECNKRNSRIREQWSTWRAERGI